MNPASVGRMQLFSFHFPGGNMSTILPNQVHTFLVCIVWFTNFPCCVVSQRCAICPVKLVVSSSLKSYPCFMSRQLRRFLEKVKERLILDGWCNFSELSSKFLAVSHGVFPFPGWNVEDFHNELNFLGKLIVMTEWDWYKCACALLLRLCRQRCNLPSLPNSSIWHRQRFLKETRCV